MEEIDKLIKELNELSEFEEQNLERMVEIAKILLTEHYKYLPRNKNKNADDGMGDMLKTDKKNLK